MEKIPLLTPAPHLRSAETTSRVMWTVVLALMPAAAGGVYFFGFHALNIILVTILTCVISEVVCQAFFRRPFRIADGSAVVTGLLLSFVIPPTLPLWMAVLGGFLAIFLVKELFGGLGYNIFNPALAARAILLASFPVEMTRFLPPFQPAVDAVTAATPLAIVKENLAGNLPSLGSLFLGIRPGCLGETSVLLLLVGAAILLARKIITWHIPFTYLLTVALLAAVFRQNVLFHLFSGGLILGAFFMATDYVTSPLSTRGKLIFGVGCGVITMLIRMRGGYPEGVCYAILFMNILVPVIDRATMPTVYGQRPVRKMRSGHEN
ncbi:MAG: RnfABCDGE type electron transport complex subunit D [Candidatus Omnitrophica bacterium]|nr:RnfABCDGE type electron transport complex subunit D [Candidatus Omnitrophota bacterium]